MRLASCIPPGSEMDIDMITDTGIVTKIMTVIVMLGHATNVDCI